MTHEQSTAPEAAVARVLTPEEQARWDVYAATAEGQLMLRTAGWVGWRNARRAAGLPVEDATDTRSRPGVAAPDRRVAR